MSKAEAALAKVQNLYVLQMQLIHLLSEDLSDPGRRKEAKNQMRQFNQLLTQVDRGYMGGEDVWEALKELPKEVQQKLKASPVSVRRMKTMKSAVRPAKVMKKKKMVKGRK